MLSIEAGECLALWWNIYSKIEDLGMDEPAALKEETEEEDD